MPSAPPKLFLTEKQLDEFDALADYLVMALVHGAEGVSKHAQHDQSAHGNWAKNRNQLVAIRGYQERAGAKGFSGWNPAEKSPAKQMAEVTVQMVEQAREALKNKLFSEEIPEWSDEQRANVRARRREAALRRHYYRNNIEKMPDSVRSVFDNLASVYQEIEAGDTPPDKRFGETMEVYADMTGKPLDVARREFRSMMGDFDPFGLYYPTLRPNHWTTTEEGQELWNTRFQSRNRKLIDHANFSRAMDRAGQLREMRLGLISAESTFRDDPTRSNFDGLRRFTDWDDYANYMERKRKRNAARDQGPAPLPSWYGVDGDGDGFVNDGTDQERRVTKHGSHDQRSHGNWARGRSAFASGALAAAKDELDTEGKYSARANLLATQLRSAQIVHEPKLTRLLDKIAVEEGGMMEGLKYRAKTTESIARKIDKKVVEEGLTHQEAAADIKDVLRYTFRFPQASYTDSVLETYEALAEQGYRIAKSKNFWAPGDAYDGVNANLLHPDGFLFEVQFHTPASSKVKKPSHKLYDIYRDEKGDYTQAERLRAWNTMVKLWGGVPRPPGIEGLETFLPAEVFKSLAKAAFRYFAKVDDNGKPRAYYRFAKGKRRIVEERWDRSQNRWVDDADKSVSWWMVSGMPIELEEVENPNLGGVAKASGGLSRWFDEEWVDISRPKKGGGFEPCGRRDADEGKYPKCVPKSKAMKMSQAEIDSAVRRKRRAESTQERDGKKPINVSTSVKKSKNVPANPKLYAKVKAEAKRKFDVYPSAYANGWLVQEYKRRGGTYKTVEKQQPTSSDVHVPSTEWKKRKKKRKKTGLSGMVDKHAQHDQKSHGNWATGGGSPKVSGPTKKRDAHISQYGLLWTDGNDENPDVIAAKKIPDVLWRQKPKEMFDPSELNPTEEWIGSRHVDKVVSGREPFREGYDPYVIRDRQGKLWIVDGHHRAAMYAGLGQKMPAHVWDWGLSPTAEIETWRSTIDTVRRKMGNLSNEYPGNEAVQSSERKRMADSVAEMERRIKELEAERERLGLSKHAQHDQKSHGNWATGGSVPNPKPYAGRGKSTEGGDAARPLPKVGDRIGIHLDLGGKESGLGKAVAFSIKMVGKNGVPKYGTTQAHTTGVRLSDVSSHVNRSGLEDAIKRGEKNPHAAFTGTVEEWTTDRGIPEGAIEIDYWVAPKAKNADGSPKYTAETTGFWYAKDGTYREFIGASDGVGVGGVKGESRARTYVYGDVELGEVNPHIKEAMESRGIGKAHRLIHESRALSLKKHAEHDQKSHGNWATGGGQAYQLDIFGGETKYGVKLTPEQLERRGLPSSLDELVELLQEDGDAELGLTVEQVMASYDLYDSDFTAGGMTVALSSAEADEMSHIGWGRSYANYFLIEERKDGKSIEITYEDDFWDVFHKHGFDDFDAMGNQAILDWRDELAYTGTLYHGTDVENVASIAKDGLEAMKVTRGGDNRHIGNAIFMSMDSYFSLSYYANNQDEGLIEIDFQRLLDDGVLDIEGAFPEPPVADRFALEGLAEVFGADAYGDSYGNYPDTTVIYEGDITIPPEYLSINGVPLTEMELEKAARKQPSKKEKVSMQERLARVRALYEHVPDRYKADPEEAKKKLKKDD